MKKAWYQSPTASMAAVPAVSVMPSPLLPEAGWPEDPKGVSLLFPCELGFRRFATVWCFDRAVHACTVLVLSLWLALGPLWEVAG